VNAKTQMHLDSTENSQGGQARTLLCIP